MTGHTYYTDPNIYDVISILGTGHGPLTTVAMIQTFGGRVGERQHDPLVSRVPGNLTRSSALTWCAVC